MAGWFRLSLLGGALLSVPLAKAADSATQLSLASRYPKETLEQILIPRAQWHPFPTVRDRAEWEALPASVSFHLIHLGEQSLATPLPSLTATRYLEFARIGDRSHFEEAYFERRAQLQNLALAECTEAKGRFLDPAADALWAICEESSWCLPAHVGVQKARVGLPDIEEPIVDLFAAETGVTVAWTLYLLGPELDRVSPRLRQRAELELQRRLLNPVRERDDFGWMALQVTSPDHRPNNWTPWISASVLTVALLEEADPSHRIQIVHKLLRSIDGFLRFYPKDGSCDEGPGYWARAAGSLLDCLDILHKASNGAIEVFAEPVVREMGRFICRAHINGDYFVPVGDCDARFTPERDVVFRFGQRLADRGLMTLGASGATVSSILGERFLGRQIYGVFDADTILKQSASSDLLLQQVWLGSQDLQLMTSRDFSGSAKGLYVAAWGGHNAQSHNHNDVGNVLVFADGQPVLVDAGAPTYTAQTFSAKRYDHWAFQSAFHNVPLINGQMQSAGRAFAARNVVCLTNDSVSVLEMNIESAYPPAAGVKTWKRTVRHLRGQSIELSDTFELQAVTGETSLAFLTPLEVDLSHPGRVIFQRPSPQGEKSLSLDYQADRLTVTNEVIVLTDERLQRVWGARLNHLVLKAKAPQLQNQWVEKIALIEESGGDH